MNYRVIQVCETGEPSCTYEGTADACDAWIAENEENYPESTFYVETDCPTNWSEEDDIY